MPQPLRVCVTGAAGQIGYALLPSIAKGDVFGLDQPIALVLFDLERCENIMKGIVVELEDLASPVLVSTTVAVTADVAFSQADYIVCLAGAMAMGKDTPRIKLIAINKPIYEEHGKAINQYAKSTCKILVVANPDNTLALILSRNAPNIPKHNITSMNRLDYNRAQGLIARKLGIRPQDVFGVVIWGNHADSMVPDYSNAYALVDGRRQKVTDLITDSAFFESFVPEVQLRAYKVVELRKYTSVASSAKAACDHLREWHFGTPEGHYSIMGVYSPGAYGAPADIFFSSPVIIKNGQWSIVPGLELPEKIKTMIKATADDLLEERASVS